jgi:hypothetical protein
VNPAAVEVVFSPNVYEVPVGRIRCYDEPTLITECQTGRHVEETYNKLSRTLKIWQWHRPYSFSELAGRLEETLRRIGNAYNEIRGYSLLEFDEIPHKPSEMIWHELGWVKTFEKNNSGYYLAMATTKPFMFLWGQTLAFDSVVRKRMPRFNILGISDNYWSFEKWRKVMMRFQESLKHQPQVADLFKEISSKEYGTSSIVPYGQFIDLYYWVRCQQSVYAYTGL